LAIYKRATKAVEEKDMFDMYSILVRKTAELFGQTKTREIYGEMIEALPQDRIKDGCLRYSKMETMLGEVDRARAIYAHAAQYCDPRKEEEYWKTWRSFEVQHGNEDTFRDMLRVKRSVQATYAQVHFNATDIAAEASTEVLDPMAAAEKELQEAEEKKRGGGAAGGDAKRQRTNTTDAATARKELLGSFQPAAEFEGPRQGFVFKAGLKGLGYYEDASVQVLERRAAEKAENERREAMAERRALASENPEEIELDMDLDDDGEEEAGGAAASSSSAAPAARASKFNPEEIELNFEDIEQAPVPAEVFGGSLAKVHQAVEAEAGAEEEPPLMDEEEAPADKKKTGAAAALSRFMKKGKGRGKGGGK